MKSSGQKIVRVRVNFPDRGLAWSVLEDLSRDSGLTVNILRGRITEADATFELEVKGTARRVDDLLRLSAGWGAPVGSQSLVVA